MDIISSNRHIARKDHKCNFCAGLINKGEKYDSQTCKYDGIYVWKSHLRCIAIADKLRMFDDCDKGVTQDDFYETIKEEFKELTKSIQSLTHTFEEKLNFVCDHYLV